MSFTGLHISFWSSLKPEAIAPSHFPAIADLTSGSGPCQPIHFQTRCDLSSLESFGGGSAHLQELQSRALLQP